jgi:hypothetical protein
MDHSASESSHASDTSGAPDNRIKNPLDRDESESDRSCPAPQTNQAQDPGPNLIKNPLDKSGARKTGSIDPARRRIRHQYAPQFLKFIDHDHARKRRRPS